MRILLVGPGQNILRAARVRMPSNVKPAKEKLESQTLPLYKHFKQLMEAD